MMRSIAVTARWDAESRRWWTDGEDVPGLCCEGQNFEDLSEAVFALAPDLLVANGAAREGEKVEIVLTAEQRKTATAQPLLRTAANARLFQRTRSRPGVGLTSVGIFDLVHE